MQIIKKDVIIWQSVKSAAEKAILKQIARCIVLGFNFRKSINLGCGFRINLSKSGIGYSWGVGGFRITKTAKGTIRRTASIRGTGISYTSETGTRKRDTVQSREQNNYYDTENIVNSSADLILSEGLEDILSVARSRILIDHIANIGMICSTILMLVKIYFIIALLIFIIVKVYIRTLGLIGLDYVIDDDQKDVVHQRINPFARIASSEKCWRIIQSNKVIDKKYTGGASSSVKRVLCKTFQRAVFPFKSGTEAVSFKSGSETLIFLPDKLFIIQGNKIGALDYNDISKSVCDTRFIEDGIVPTDAQIVGYTWQYVNKSGGPDKRFKNNRKLPICQYGEVKLKSALGLNTIIMFSNTETGK